MRLIHTKTKCFFEFSNVSEIPPYAILSHRWNTREVIFEDMLNVETLIDHPGFSKLSACCETARTHGYEYVWIDTCCINKASSAELSEAINSMYVWYRDAAVCFVYLHDVSHADHPGPDADSSEFARSAWFTRGWTLQELLAPSNLVFFANDWSAIGTKLSLADVVARITRVDVDALRVPESVLKRFSIAQRMSWAALRQTTREEDRAYSLMGIFGVNMPTIYGEGSNAFRRLQEEVLQNSTDQSIFAWRKDISTSTTGILLSPGINQDASGKWSFHKPRWPQRSSGLLASSPDDFMGSSNIVPILPEDMGSIVAYPHPAYDYSMTNDGIRINLPYEVDHRSSAYIAYLSCRVGLEGGVVAIFLQRSNRQQYTRISPYELMEFPTSHTAGLRHHEDMYIRERPSRLRDHQSSPPPDERVIMYLGDDQPTSDLTEEESPTGLIVYDVRDIDLQESGFVVADRAPMQKWSDDSGENGTHWALTTRYPRDVSSHLAGCVVYTSPDSHDRFLVTIGFRMSDRVGRELQICPWVYVFDLIDTSSDITATSLCQRWQDETRGNAVDLTQPLSFEQGVSFASFMSELLDSDTAESEQADGANASEKTPRKVLEREPEPTWAVIALRSGKRVTVNVTIVPPPDPETSEGDTSTFYEVRISVQ